LEQKLDAILSAHRPRQKPGPGGSGNEDATKDDAEQSLSLRFARAIASAGSMVWRALTRIGLSPALKAIDQHKADAKKNDTRIPAIILQRDQGLYTLGVLGGPDSGVAVGGEEAAVTEVEGFDLLLGESGNSPVLFVIPDEVGDGWLSELRGMQALLREALGPEAPLVVTVVWVQGSGSDEEQERETQRHEGKTETGAEALAKALHRVIGAVGPERPCFAYAHGRSTEALLLAAGAAASRPCLARVFLSAGTARSAGFECPWPATIFSSASDADELIISGGCIGQEPLDFFGPESPHRQVWVCATSSLALTVREPQWVGAHDYMLREGLVLAVGVEVVLTSRSSHQPDAMMAASAPFASCPPRSVSELTEYLATGMAGHAVDALLQLCSVSPHLTGFVASRAEQQGGRLIVRLKAITDKDIGPKAHAILERLRPHTAMTLPIIRNALF
jgi:hypothetical protein